MRPTPVVKVVAVCTVPPTHRLHLKVCSARRSLRACCRAGIQRGADLTRALVASTGARPLQRNGACRGDEDEGAVFRKRRELNVHDKVEGISLRLQYGSLCLAGGVPVVPQPLVVPEADRAALDARARLGVVRHTPRVPCDIFSGELHLERHPLRELTNLPGGIHGLNSIPPSSIPSQILGPPAGSENVPEKPAAVK